MAEDTSAKALQAFAALSPADRAAIERLLSPPERRALRALQRTPRRAPESTPARPDLSGHSPWLAKRIVQILASKSPIVVTDAAREALRQQLTTSRVTP